MSNLVCDHNKTQPGVWSIMDKPDPSSPTLEQNAWNLQAQEACRHAFLKAGLIVHA